MTYDLMAVDPAWRVVSMVGVGVMMLAVAVGYGRFASGRPSRGLAARAGVDGAA